LIRVITVGYVDEEFKSMIEMVAREFYSKAGGEPELLEIYVYSTSARKRHALIREAESLGVVAVGDYIVMHEAWRGWPRIHVDYEQCSKLEGELLRALLLHELAHSKLHGSPYYYIIPVWSSLVEKYGERAPIVAYLASVVVKDVEVIALLKSLGYDREIMAYTRLLDSELPHEECFDIEDMLNFAKLLVPHVVMSLTVDSQQLKGICRDALRRVEEILVYILESKGTLDDKVRTLVGMVEDLLRARQ